GRGALDTARGDRPRRAAAGHDRGAVHAFPLPREQSFLGADARGAAQSVRRPSGQEVVTIVIFGGAGDLAHRKLLPALYNLAVDGLLPANTAIVGVGRKAMTDDEYRAFAKD